MNGPSCFGRLSALTARISQSLVDTTELRMQVYTDDPCMIIRGSQERCQRLASLMVLLWLILGWSLSYHKAQFGKSVGWIGYKLEIGENQVIAKIKEEFMKEFHDLTVEMLAKPKLTLDSLRSYAGQANHVAGMLFSERPLLDTLWAALHSPPSQKRPERRTT